MIGNKKLQILILLSITAMSCLLAVSFVDNQVESHSFDSEVRLNEWDFNPSVENEEFYNNMDIELLTVSKGDPVYSWFGHSAIAVIPEGQEGYVFDYGIFSFSSKFYQNFALGRLWYKVLASYKDLEYERFEEDKRTVYSIKLDLSPEKKKACADFLLDNIKEENQTYLYHNFLDNCATRDRDIINYLTDGDFKEWALQQPGLTFRKQASKILSVNPFVNWLLNFLLGPYVDKQNTLWEDMYIPEVLHNAVLSYGKITESTSIPVDQRMVDTRKPSYENYSFFRELLIPTLFSLFFALFIFIFKKRQSRTGLGLMVFFVNIFFALISVILLFMMLFSNHDYSYFNENIIFINPFLFIVAFRGLSIVKNRMTLINKLEINCKVLFFIILVLIFLKIIFPLVFSQNNWVQIFTMMIIYFSIGFFPWKKEKVPTFEKVN